MANFCHNCAQAVSELMRACPNCGTLLSETPSGATATASAPDPPKSSASSFGSYLPPREDPRPLSSNSHLGEVLRGSATYPKAGFGARLMAHVIDVVVGLLGLVPVFFAFIIASAGGSLESGLVVLSMIAAVCWAIGYTFTKDGWRGGASIGKRAMGLMVVHLPTNEPCTIGQSAIRQIIWLVLQIVPVIGWLVEPVAVLVADGGRRIGDHAASTQVIETGEYSV